MFNFVTDGYSYQLIMLVYKKYHGIGHTLHLIDAIAHPRVRGLTRLTKGGGGCHPSYRPDRTYTLLMLLVGRLSVGL